MTKQKTVVHHVPGGLNRNQKIITDGLLFQLFTSMEKYIIIMLIMIMLEYDQLFGYICTTKVHLVTRIHIHQNTGQPFEFFLIYNSFLGYVSCIFVSCDDKDLATADSPEREAAAWIRSR